MNESDIIIPEKLRAEVQRVHRDIAAANQLLMEAFDRQARLTEQAAGSELSNLLAASGVSLAAERLKLLYRREAELEEMVREHVSANLSQDDEVESRVTLLIAACG